MKINEEDSMSHKTGILSFVALAIDTAHRFILYTPNKNLYNSQIVGNNIATSDLQDKTHFVLMRAPEFWKKWVQLEQSHFSSCLFTNEIYFFTGKK